MKSLLSLISLLLFPLFVSAQLLNGSFETESSPTLDHWSGPCALGESFEAGAPGAGDWSLQLPSGNFQGCFPGYYFQLLPGVEGSYQLSGWVRSGIAGRVRTLALAKQTATGELVIIAADTTSATEWKELSVMGDFELQPGETAAVLLDPGNTSGPQLLNDAGFYDGLRLEKLTGTQDVFSCSVRLFPNPVRGNVLFIHAGGLALRKVYLFAMDGRSIVLPEQNGYALQVGDLPPGLYWLVLETEKGKIAGSFVKA